MYKIEDGQIVKTVEEQVGGLEEVVEELTKISAAISAYTANLERATTAFNSKVPELEAMKEALITKAKLLPQPDNLTDECIAKLQEYNII